MCECYEKNITVIFGENYIYVLEVSLMNYNTYELGYYKEIAKI